MQPVRAGLHNVAGDVAGMACRRKAKRGGESFVSGAVAAHNILPDERPDLLETPQRKSWFERLNGKPPGRSPCCRQPVFARHGEPVSTRCSRTQTEGARRLQEPPHGFIGTCHGKPTSGWRGENPPVPGAAPDRWRRLPTDDRPCCRRGHADCGSRSIGTSLAGDTNSARSTTARAEFSLSLSYALRSVDRVRGARTPRSEFGRPPPGNVKRMRRAEARIPGGWSFLPPCQSKTCGPHRTDAAVRMPPLPFR